MKSKGVAILLALMLGGIGGHKYYLGQVGQGVLYTLFFWTWVPLILSIFDILIYIFTSDKNWDKRYNQHLIQNR